MALVRELLDQGDVDKNSTGKECESFCYNLLLLLDTKREKICPGLTLIRCMRISISATKCPFALLANFDITHVSEYRQFMSQSVLQIMLFK